MLHWQNSDRQHHSDAQNADTLAVPKGFWSLEAQDWHISLYEYSDDYSTVTFSLDLGNFDTEQHAKHAAEQTEQWLIHRVTR